MCSNGAVLVRSGADHPLATSYRAEGWWDDRTLADGLETAARASPDARALTDNDESLTHADLAARVHGAVAALAGQRRAARAAP